MAVSKFDLVQGVGMQSLRSRPNCHVEIITQRGVLPFDGKPDHNPHPADLLPVTVAQPLVVAKRAVCNTPIADRSSIPVDTVAVLFARSDSVYKSLPFCDVYDIDRDARRFDGLEPVIAHPPCRGWGRLRTFSSHTPEELDLARLAVSKVRLNGGVLEHPYGSALWEDQRLPQPGHVDQYGGFTLPLFQNWFGHRAAKATLLYIVGVAPGNVPSIPFTIAKPSHVCGAFSGNSEEVRRPEISKAEREQTPVAFAVWLLDLARRVGK